MRKQINILFVSMCTLAALCIAPSVAFAQCATNPDQQACSSGPVKYGVSETFFGTGGSDTCLEWAQNAGKTYCAKQSAGELTVGNTKGGSLYQAQAGFNTDRTPWVEATITKSSVDLGAISASTTGFDYAAFTVKSYLAHGYVVQIAGTAPKNGAHEITPMAAGGASSPGTEQFGLNLRDNTAPNIGANPVQQPDGTFSFGTYATGYGTVDSFRYVDGAVIAESASSSGYTDYTISYIMNIAGITPGGTYTTNQSIVVTATF